MSGTIHAAWSYPPNKDQNENYQRVEGSDNRALHHLRADRAVARLDRIAVERSAVALDMQTD